MIPMFNGTKMAEYLHPGGVWSNPEIHRDNVSTPEYFWCIASHCYACCLPIQAYTCETTFNGVKMAEYLHPGRGVVKPRDPQRYIV